MSRTRFVFTTLLFFFTNIILGQLFSDNYYFYKPDLGKSNNKWIILLPGSSGLKIFDDRTFYNRQADTLKSLGYSIILLDYKSFYKSSQEKTKAKGSLGDKISWTIKEVISLAKNKKQIDSTQTGHIIGWSLAGEGVFRLLKDSSYIAKNKIKSAVLFYPSNREKKTITSAIPLLIQIGQEDNVVVAQKIKCQIENEAKAQLIIYPNSSHGFDIESLKEERKIKFPPLVGKKYSFKYNRESASLARIALYDFLNK